MLRNNYAYQGQIYFPLYFMKVLFSYSSKARRSSSWVFIRMCREWDVECVWTVKRFPDESSPSSWVWMGCF
jgi:hypothetical protein